MEHPGATRQMHSSTGDLSAQTVLCTSSDLLAWSLSHCSPSVSGSPLRIPNSRGIIPASNEGHRNPLQSE